MSRALSFCVAIVVDYRLVLAIDLAMAIALLSHVVKG
jgi:hypothetical protein